MRYIPILLLLLAGCASNSPSPATTVYASKSTYEAALALAVAYAELPRCAPDAPPLCSDTSAVATIRTANTAARATLDAAENTVRSAPSTDAARMAVVAASNAVDAFSKIVALYRGGK